MTTNVSHIPMTSACSGDGGSPTNSKTPSVSSSTTGTTTINDQNPNKKRLESMADEEIIQKNFQELMDKKNREERKANGRLVAVILASLVIFLAIYHAWIRKSGILAGVLVPAVIMVSFGGWVVVLAKRDKARRAIFEKYLEEIAQKNKQELEAKKLKAQKKSHERTSSNETILQYVNEINKDPSSTMTVTVHPVVGAKKTKEHRKNRRHRKATGDSSSIDSSSSSKNSSHYATKDLRIKRPSIRQKLFRQAGLYHITGGGLGNHHNTTHSLVQAVINTPTLQPMGGPQVLTVDVRGQTLAETKRKRLQRLDALPIPAMVRMGSAP